MHKATHTVLLKETTTYIPNPRICPTSSDKLRSLKCIAPASPCRMVTRLLAMYHMLAVSDRATASLLLGVRWRF